MLVHNIKLLPADRSKTQHNTNLTPDNIPKKHPVSFGKSAKPKNVWDFLKQVGKVILEALDTTPRQGPNETAAEFAERLERIAKREAEEAERIDTLNRYS